MSPARRAARDQPTIEALTELAAQRHRVLRFRRNMNANGDAWPGGRRFFTHADAHDSDAKYDLLFRASADGQRLEFSGRAELELDIAHPDFLDRFLKVVDAYVAWCNCPARKSGPSKGRLPGI